MMKSLLSSKRRKAIFFVTLVATAIAALSIGAMFAGASSQTTVRFCKDASGKDTNDANLCNQLITTSHGNMALWDVWETPGFAQRLKSVAVFGGSNYMCLRYQHTDYTTTTPVCSSPGSSTVTNPNGTSYGQTQLINENSTATHVLAETVTVS
jgi:hypothetical protein